GLYHPFDRRGAVPRRSHRDHDRQSGPHQRDRRRAVPASAQSDGAVGDAALRRAQAQNLARTRERGEPRARERGRGMSAIEGGSEARRQLLQERLLYLLSPIGLLVLWQLAIMAGLGDRRFLPAPSDIAERFWLLCVSGELPWDTAVTLWRIL